MTSVVRFVKNTMDGGEQTPKIGSTGGDYQLIALEITTTAGIAADADADILEWSGAGKIKSILSFIARVKATGELIPSGIAAANTHTLLSVDAAGKVVNVSVPAAGVAIPANSSMALLLVIGNY